MKKIVLLLIFTIGILSSFASADQVFVDMQMDMYCNPWEGMYESAGACFLDNNIQDFCDPTDDCWDFYQCADMGGCIGQPSFIIQQCLDMNGCSYGAGATYLGTPLTVGDGSAGNPYQISTCTNLYEDLDNHCEDNSYFELANDLDCSGYTFVEEPACQHNIDGFKGTIDGKGHTISNVYASINGYSVGGVVAASTGATVIKNIKIDNLSLSGSETTGGFVGRMRAGTLQNVTIQNSNINSGGGLLAGMLYSGTSVVDSYVKYSNKSSIAIVDNYFLGLLNRTYVMADTSTNQFFSSAKNVQNSYYNTEYGLGADASGAIGLTDAEMKDPSNFADWDFDGVWGINDNDGYPCLLFESDCSAYGATNNVVSVCSEISNPGNYIVNQNIAGANCINSTTDIGLTWIGESSNITFFLNSTDSLSGNFSIGENIIITNNSVYINSIALPSLDRPANITMSKGTTTYLSPQILRDGEICTDCIQYTSNLNDPIVTFGVTGFSNYTFGEGALINLNSPANSTINKNSQYETFMASINSSNSFTGDLLLWKDGGRLDMSYNMDTAVYQGRGTRLVKFINGDWTYRGRSWDFKDDGTVLYHLDDYGNDLIAFNLGTPWDMTTIDINTYEYGPVPGDTRGGYMTSDGTNYYHVSGTTITQYNLTTPWNVTTMTNMGGFIPGGNTHTDVVVSDDGTRMWDVDTENITEYTLSDPYNISSAVTTGNVFNPEEIGATLKDVVFTSDGRKLIIAAGTIYSYYLTTPYDITTAIYQSDIIVTAQDPNPDMIAFNPNGTQMFVYGEWYFYPLIYNLDTTFQPLMNSTIPYNSDSLFLENGDYLWNIESCFNSTCITADENFTLTMAYSPPTLVSNSSSAEVLVENSPWSVFVTFIDDVYTTVTVYVQFFVNDVVVGPVYEYVAGNNTEIEATLGDGNFSAGDNLTAQIYAANNDSNSTPFNLTAEVINAAPTTAINSPPANVVVIGDKFYLNESPDFTNMTAFYALEEAANPMIDSHSDYNATASRISFQAEGVSGYGLSFPATRTDASYTAPKMLLPGSFQSNLSSVSLWVKPGTMEITPQHFLEDGYHSGSYYKAGIDNDNKFYVQLYNFGSPVTLTSNVTAQNDSWYHIFVSWGDEGLELWVNGELEDSDPITNHVGRDTLYLGSTSQYYYSWDGDVDEVAVFSTRPSNATIASLYLTGLAGSSYPFGKEIDNEVIWTTTDIENNSYKTNITLDNGTSTNIITGLTDNISSYLWNGSLFAPGFYNLTVESCEDDTAELFCSADTVALEIQAPRVAPAVTINSPPAGSVVIGNRLYGAAIDVQENELLTRIIDASYTDISGRDLPITNRGTEIVSDPEFGDVYYFDGTDTIDIDFSGVPPLDSLGYRYGSMGLWFKRNDTSNSRLIYADGGYPEKGLYFSGDNLRIRWKYSSSAQPTPVNISGGNDNKWHHVMHTWDYSGAGGILGPRTMRLWYDGELVLEENTTENSIEWYLYDGSGKVKLGDKGFVGYMSDIMIYGDVYDSGSALSEESVLEIYNNGVKQLQNGENYVSWTTTDVENDSYKTNITLDNGTSTNIITDLADNISSYLWNGSLFAPGFYNLTVESCENDTAELFCSADTVALEIQEPGIAPVVSISAPPSGALIVGDNYYNQGVETPNNITWSVTDNDNYTSTLSYNGTILASGTTDNYYYWDTEGVAPGDYVITVETCEVDTVELLCTDAVTNVTVQTLAVDESNSVYRCGTIPTSGTYTVNQSISGTDCIESYANDVNLVFSNDGSNVTYFLNSGETLGGDFSYGTNIIITADSAYIDSTALQDLNREANVTLNKGSTNYLLKSIMRDGVPCTDCTQYTADVNDPIVTFGVTGFSNYTVGDEPGLELVSPTNNSGYNTSWGPRDITFAVNDSNLDTCWYNIAGVNTVTTCNTAFQYLVLDGENLITYYVNDTDGNQNSTSLRMLGGPFVTIESNDTTSVALINGTTQWEESANLTFNSSSPVTNWFSWVVGGTVGLAGYGENVFNWVFNLPVEAYSAVVNLQTYDLPSPCYQESPSISNQTGIDGNCGLDYSGTSSAYGNWNDPARPQDGSWSTYGQAPSSTATLDVVYVKPEDAGPNSLWHIGPGVGSVNRMNLTIPQACWDYSEDNISLRNVQAQSATETGYFYCYNGTWDLLYTTGTGTFMYEEAMIWDFNQTIISDEEFVIETNSVNPELNLTYPISQTNYEGTPTFNISLNWTASDENLAACWYNIGGGNVTIADDCTSTTSTSVEVTKGYYDITLYVNDSATNVVSSTAYNVSINNAYPVITTGAPNNTGLFVYENDSMNLTWTVTDDNLDSCWYEYGTQNVTIVACANNTAPFYYEFGYDNITFYANDTSGNVANELVELYIPVYYNNESYNNNASDTEVSKYNMTFTTPEGINSVTLNAYIGNLGATLLSKDGNTYTYYATQNQQDGFDGNRSFYWTVVTEDNTYTTKTYYQTITDVDLFDCSNDTNNSAYINFKFYDENTLEPVNTTNTIGAIIHYTEESPEQKTYEEVGTTELSDASYCYEWPERSLDIETAFKYKADGYPLRTHSNTYTGLTNETTNVSLYLLSSTDGLYVSALVVDGNNNPLSDSHITWTRNIAGIPTIIGQDDTDDSGSATFWVNPDYPHTIKIENDNCDTKISSITPTQASYTIPLNCDGASYTYSSPTEGVSFKKRPTVGLIEQETGDSTLFEYQIASTIHNMTAVKFRLINFYNRSEVFAENETYTADGTGCEKDFCTLSLNLDVIGKNIIGEYYVLMENELSYTLLEGDGQWIEINNGSTSDKQGTLWAFLGNLNSYFGETKNENGQTIEQKKIEFSRIVLVFFFLALLLAFVGKYTGYDAVNPGSFSIILTGILIVLSIPGFLTIQNAGFGEGWEFFDKYAIAIVTGCYSIASTLSMWRRQHA